MSVLADASQRVKLAGAVTLAVLVSGGAVASSAAASNVLTLRGQSTKLVAEPGVEVIGSFWLEAPNCEVKYSGKLDTNQSASDKLSFTAETSRTCNSPHEGRMITGGKLKSITATPAGVATFAFSPALKVKGPGPKGPGPCYYSYSKWSGTVPGGPVFSVPLGDAKGMLIKTGSSPECALEQTSHFKSQEFLSGFENIATELQLSSYKATAQVQSGVYCNIPGGNGSPFIGTAKFTRNSAKSTVTVTYKVKGVSPSTLLTVDLLGYTGGKSCEFLGSPVNTVTKTSTFTTSLKGEGSFTGVLAVPRNTTEFSVVGRNEGFGENLGSLVVSLP